MIQWEQRSRRESEFARGKDLGDITDRAWL